MGDRIAPSGCFLASILNPRGWRNRLREIVKPARGTRILTTDPYTSYLHSVDGIRQAASPFHLAGGANAGAAARYAPVTSDGGRPAFWRRPGPLRIKELLWRTPLYRSFGQFTFLLLRRND